jgi:putative restriction endonuclease
MEQLQKLLEPLPERHRSALSWFIERTGTEQNWPEPLPDGTLLATKAKGIYKPSWTSYALTVRQTLGGPYPDRDPVLRADGSWSYFYFQENHDAGERDSEFTNRGLISCWRDKVPVAVMRQVTEQPRSQYRIWGLALVAGWGNGYFILEGFRSDGQSAGAGTAVELRQEEAALAAAQIQPPGLESMVDTREKILALIIRRQGQPAFRQNLLQAYERRCAITGCDVVDALEAAHILPYCGPESNQTSNGLLLRADVHTLFDLGLITIEPESMTVLVSPALAQSTYRDYAGMKLQVPLMLGSRPNVAALEQHRRWSGY